LKNLFFSVLEAEPVSQAKTIPMSLIPSRSLMPPCGGEQGDDAALHLFG
jgi:hypothetical protein